MGVSFHGAFFQFDDVTIEPRPARYFTVWVAGGSRIRMRYHPTNPIWLKLCCNASPTRRCLHLPGLGQSRVGGARL